VIPDDQVFNQLKDDFVLVAQYTDDQKDATPARNLQKYTQGQGIVVPLWIVTDANGKEIDRLVPETNINNLTPEKFASFLREAKQKYAASNG
jgi:hypothetical protein